MLIKILFVISDRAAIGRYDENKFENDVEIEFPLLSAAFSIDPPNM